MNIRDAIRFPFRGSRPWANIGLLAVCYIIPIIGPLVALGYGAIVEKSLVRDLDAEAPTFDFANFTKYLERGVAPFIVGLIAGFAVVPVIWGLMFIGFLAIVASHGATWALVLAISLTVLAAVATALFLMLVMLPFTLRASLLGSIGGAFDFRWAFDFIKRVGGRAVFSFVVLQLVAIPLMLAGLCALYVGMFLTISIIGFMQWHMQIQLYHLYLDRGGTPLAIPDEPMLPAFPVVHIPAAPGGP